MINLTKSRLDVCGKTVTPTEKCSIISGVLENLQMITRRDTVGCVSFVALTGLRTSVWTTASAQQTSARIAAGALGAGVIIARVNTPVWAASALGIDKARGSPCWHMRTIRIV